MKTKFFIGFIFCFFILSAFSQESKWKTEEIVDVFGDKTGICKLYTVFYDADGVSKTEIQWIKSKEDEMMILIYPDYDPEITERKINLSIKTESGNTINAETGYYVKSEKNPIAIFKSSDEIVSAFKISKKLKLALILTDGYKPTVYQVDCEGFTKAYNEFLNCN